jgi:DNA glycosylase AlkZ-like
MADLRMTRDALARTRLSVQRLVGAPFPTVAAAVAWFGAVQAQDYRAALWGIGQRVRAATEADVERAIASREIARTWPMRGTLHLLAAADIHWITRLLAPRALARAAGRHRELGLDARTLARAGAVFAKELAGGVTRTRDELYELLAKNRISPAGQRGIHVLAALAMQGLVCFGPHRGKQPTFTLLDEWIPPPPPRDRDDALRDLATRYFTSHGPATLADFVWWTGLPVADARRAVALASLDELAVGGTAHYWVASRRRATGPRVHLLPPYDELTVAYRDRSAVLDPAHAAATKNGIFSPVIAVDGRIVGTWTREMTRDRIVVRASLLRRVATAGLDDAVARFGAFHGRSAELRRVP